MSNLQRVFTDKKRVLISFVTAGYPSMDKTEEFILKLAEAGSDIIEIGIPFSDPVAEGEIIEGSYLKALEAGTTTDDVFEMVGRVRKKTDASFIFLTYINVIFVYGADKFLQRCKDCGIDGIIIPDLPFEEKGEISGEAEKYGIDLITIIAPTSKDRINAIASGASGFIYALVSAGAMETTASTISEIRQATKMPIVARIVDACTEEQAKEILKMADGIIADNALIKIIEKYGNNAGEHLANYLKWQR